MELKECESWILAHEALQLVGELPAALQRGHQAALQRQLRGIAVHGGERRGRVGDVFVRARWRASERARVTSWL